MTHDFKKSKTRLSNDPLKDYWECLNCDSGVLILKGRDAAAVNRALSKRMPCLPPIFTPKDGIIDNRTTIKQEPKIITSSKKN